jgi:predicted chitinase
MHLRTLADRSSDAKGKAAPWKVGDRVYRKDVLGEAGRIMGAEGRLHFEIFCDEANLQNIIGRPAKWAEDEPFAAPQADGRTDAVFGSVFVYLPGTTPTSATLPGDPVRRPSGLQLGADRWVEIRYDGGSSFVSSRDASGQPVGVAPFAPLKVADFEYDMYKRAIDLHAAYLARGGSRPSSPSGWYELLRFGRNLGPDPLPADAAHWREIPAAGGSIWVDLNAAGTFKFSEADFLPATGWNCFGDDPTPDDQRCDSIELKRLIRDRDPQNPQRMTRDALCGRIAKPSVRSRLRKAICRFPSEWDRSTMLKRYEWIRGPDETFEMDKPENWERFVRHCETLTFPDLPQEVKDATWRFHPVEFISVMRRCGWLSAEEFAQCIPRKPSDKETVSWDKALARSQSNTTALNMLVTKFCGESRSRKAHLLTQVHQETGLLQFASEIGRGATATYGPFYGRGYLQITWPSNYAKYGKFKSMPDQVNPVYADTRINTTSKHSDVDGSTDTWAPKYDPEIVSRDLMHAADSTGMYWVSKKYRSTSNINRICDLPFDSISVAFICWLTNGGANGYKNRHRYAAHLKNVLFDFPSFQGSTNLRYPALNPASNPLLCRTFPPTPVPLTESQPIQYEKQRP